MTTALDRSLRILVAEDDAMIAFDVIDALAEFGCVEDRAGCHRQGGARSGRECLLVPSTVR